MGSPRYMALVKLRREELAAAVAQTCGARRPCPGSSILAAGPGALTRPVRRDPVSGGPGRQAGGLGGVCLGPAAPRDCRGPSRRRGLEAGPARGQRVEPEARRQVRCLCPRLRSRPLRARGCSGTHPPCGPLCPCPCPSGQEHVPRVLCLPRLASPRLARGLGRGQLLHGHPRRQPLAPGTAVLAPSQVALPPG